jgi:hypothetical protein
MVAAVKFQSFVERLAEGGIDLDTNAIKVALSNTAPNAATNAVIGDITQIAAGNGYATGGITLTPASSSQTGGVYSFIVNDITSAWLAGPAAMAAFRYLVLHDSVTGNLIQFWDAGSSITLNAGDSVNLDFDTVNGVLNIT